jgi:hypothetical protein
MGMKKEALQRLLEKIDSTNRRKRNLWKPKVNQDGSQCKSTVRILPYEHSEDGNPFQQLYFYYDIGTMVGERSLVAPFQSYGEPDPILDFLTELRSESNDKDSYRLWKSLQPKMRVYAPVLVRDEESEGVQWWGFSPTVLKQFLTFILDEENEDVDITDPQNGLDVYIYTEKNAGKKYYDTTITFARKESPVLGSKSSPDEEGIKNLLGDIEEIHSVFPPKPVDELEKILIRLRQKAFESSATEEEISDSGTEVGGDFSASDDKDDVMARLQAAMED